MQGAEHGGGIGHRFRRKPAERHRDLGRRPVGGPEPDVPAGSVDADEAAVPVGEPPEPAAQALGLHLDRPAAARHLPGPRHP